MGTHDNEGANLSCRGVPIINCPDGHELAYAMN